MTPRPPRRSWRCRLGLHKWETYAMTGLIFGTMHQQCSRECEAMRRVVIGL